MTVQVADQGKRTVKPMTFELIKNALGVLCDDMAITMSRSSFSPLMREVMDYSTALLTPDGEAMAQARTQLVQMGATVAALAAIRSKFGDAMRPGDIFIVNDPYEGGSHLPDIYLLKPIFQEGKLIAYVGAEAHMCDMGGRVAGSNASDSTEIYQEGLRIPPSYLFEAGTPNRTLWDILERNVRLPGRVLGDMRAMLSALDIGERGFLRLTEQYGQEELPFYVAEIMNYTERVARAEIARWPDGEYSFSDAIDDDGLDPDLIPIHVKISVRASDITFDFTGTGRQVRAAFNCPFTTIAALCSSAVRCAMPAQVPRNSGFSRPVRVIAPEGCILNPVLPAAVTARALTMYRTLDAIVGAMAQFVPERMLAGDEGGNGLITFAGKHVDGKPWIYTESYRGSWGGRHDRDGIEGICGLVAPNANVPCEVIEQDFPLQVTEYGFVPDTGGAGRFRGGLSMVRSYRVLTDGTMAQVRTDRVKTRSFGLFGGQPGAHSVNTVNPGPGQVDLPSKYLVWLKAGDVLRLQLSSAGGWGDPLEREPELVWLDLRDEKITAAYAEREHAVVFDHGTGRLDSAATERLRSERHFIPGASPGSHVP